MIDASEARKRTHESMEESVKKSFIEESERIEGYILSATKEGAFSVRVKEIINDSVYKALQNSGYNISREPYSPDYLISWY